MLRATLGRLLKSFGLSSPRKTSRRRGRSGHALETLEPRLVLSPAIGLTDDNKLVKFDTNSPTNVTATVSITGLQNRREEIIGIDFRPATGELIGVSRQGVYSINADTGVATLLQSLDDSVFKAADYGVDFNPVPDALRIVNSKDANFRITAGGGGAINTDGALAFGGADAQAGKNPNVVGAAYLNPDTDPVTGTTLYVIDSKSNTLLTQNPPNNGTLNTVGNLGINVSDDVGFDITLTGPGQNTAFLSTKSGARTRLYTVNLGTGAASLVGEIGNRSRVIDIAVQVRTTVVYAVTESQRLISFNDGAPGILLTNIPIFGQGPGELILNVDFRPQSGLLYGLSNVGTTYTINVQTGECTVAPVIVADPNDPSNPFTPLDGVNRGFDFNPVADRLRIVTDSDLNIRANALTGLAFTDGLLAFALGDQNAGADPFLAGSAYTNNFAGATSTTLYGIDTSLNVLVTQLPPNDGTLNTVGTGLGVDPVGEAGFDITSDNVAYAALTVDGLSRFYRINLATGAAILVGTIGNGSEHVVGLSVPTV